MKLTDFRIGEEFRCGDRRWRCTDIGSRIVIAIRVDLVEVSDGVSGWTLDRDAAEAEGWFNGPPYAVAETVFDEDDQEGCSRVMEPWQPP